MVEWSGILDVGKGGLQLLELDVNLLFGFLSLGNLKTKTVSEKPFAGTGACFNTHSLGFEGLNSLDGAADVVGHGLEVLQQLLRLVNNGLVL